MPTPGLRHREVRRRLTGPMTGINAGNDVRAS